MSQPFLGQISIFGFNFAPRGWAFCNGQILSISQNTALFSLIGTFYGGNGTSNFALPNLQASVPLGMGNGVGLSPYVVGQTGGTASVALSVAQLPSHSHSAQCQTGGGVENPNNAVWGSGGRGKPPAYSTTTTPSAVMNAAALASTGGNAAHNNLSPYLGLGFCIALQGIYPSRN